MDVNGRAVIGDLVSKYILLYQGSQGIVTNGKMRDAHILIKENYPIWCAGASPVGCFNQEVDVSEFEPEITKRREYYEGSIAVCDDSGVVVVPPEQVTESFYEKIVKIEEQEDIWYDCIDRRKWSTYKTICQKEYLHDNLRNGGKALRDIEKYEKEYRKEPGREYRVAQRRKIVLEQMGKYRHQKVLEIGCGLEPLFKYTDDVQEMVVVELGESFIKNLEEELGQREYKGKISYYQGFFEDVAGELASREGCFDYIVLSSLLHEVENPEYLLKSIKKVCNADTVVHINVPNAKSIHRLLAKEMGLIDDIYELSEIQKLQQRNRMFDMDKLCKMVQDCGYEIIFGGGYSIKFLSASQMQGMFEHGIADKRILVGLENLVKYFPENAAEIFVQVRMKA